MSCHFKITIPEPCHENWQEMKPDDKGKFCNSCHKTVYDFSTKSPDEIHAFFIQHKSEKLCGYFKDTQVNVPSLSLSGNRSMAITKLFAIAVYLVFGSLLFSCKSIPEPEPDGPVFQKGRFTIRELNSDSIHEKYGSTNYLDYLTPEIVDSVFTRSR